jgi:dipeptidyl aminopeptidase/acylaminoacyl peptidase
MSLRTRARLCAGYRVVLAGTALAAAPLLAGAGDEPARVLTYQTPDQKLVDLVDAPGAPEVSFGPNRRWMLILEPSGPASIKDRSRPELALAGLRIDPRTNGAAGKERGAGALTLRSLSDSTRRPVSPLPPGAVIENVRWSPDGLYLAFTVNDGETIELWVTETEGDVTKRVLRQPLNAVFPPYRWAPDSKSLFCTILPEDRPPAPAPSPVPTGPLVRDSAGGRAAAPYREDLLRTPHDEALFEHALTSQLMRAEINGKRKRLGSPGIVPSFSVSPDGRYLLVQLIHRPFSFLVPWDRFPLRTEIWDMEGALVRRVADGSSREGAPTSPGSVPPEPRAFQWRADAPATVVWVEAQDGGDSRAEARIRDTVLFLEAPFARDPAVLVSLSRRYDGIQWATDSLALVHERDGESRTVSTWWIAPGQPETEPRLLFEASGEDRYRDPGRFVTVPSVQGRDVLLTGPLGRTLYLFGNGDSPEGSRPFVDAFDLETRTSRRLWRSEASAYEEPQVLMDNRGTRLITRRESPLEPPNIVLRSLETGDVKPLTDFPNPYADGTAFSTELIHWERADGVALSGLLTLPAGRDSAGAPPLLLWIRSFRAVGADAAGQVAGSPYRFPRMDGTSPLLWVTRGFAVLDCPSLPIVGGGTGGEAIQKQLVAGAEAAVDAVVRRGAADPRRVAVGGDGIGAFIAANLLAHSDRFRAGIARNGAYNPVLTPFGFEGEDRTLWDAPGVYAGLSPFLHADAVGAPLLLIHGEDAARARGAEMFFNALQGLGATARLVLLPHESGDLRARESILHALWETERWLETHVAPRKAG